MTESKRRSNIKKIQARQRRYHALGRCRCGRELRAGYKRCANCLAQLAQRDESDSSISIAIGSLLAFLVAWGVLGCSLTGSFLAKDRAISFDIDAFDEMLDELEKSPPLDFRQISKQNLHRWRRGE